MNNLKFHHEHRIKLIILHSTKDILVEHFAILK